MTFRFHPRSPMGRYVRMVGRGYSHGRGSRRTRRPLGHGDLRLLILSLLNEAPRHGYELMTEIEERTAGAYKPSPGVIYPALEVIQDMGLAKSKKLNGKNTFELTEAGQELLEAESETVDAINKRLDELATPEEDRPGDVRMAMRSLRHTVVERVAKDWPNEELNTKVTEILANARKQINELD